MTLYALIGLSWVLVALAVVILRVMREHEPEGQWRLLLLAAAAPFMLSPLLPACGFLLDKAVTLAPLLGTAWPLALLTGGGAGLAGIRAVLVCRRQRALLAACEPPGSTLRTTLEDRLRCLTHTAGLARVPRLRVLPRGAHVCAVGWRRPVIVISRDLLVLLEEEEVEAILAHEVAHVRQRDYLVNWLGLVLRSALFYLPPWAVGWPALSEIRERRADRLATGYTGKPLALAAALIKVWQRRASGPVPLLAPAFLARSGDLEARVRRLVEPDRRPRSPWRRSLSAGFLLAGLLVVHVTVEGGTHLLARVSADIAEWEACCDPGVSALPHCVPPRRFFASYCTTNGSWLA